MVGRQQATFRNGRQFLRSDDSYQAKFRFKVLPAVEQLKQTRESFKNLEGNKELRN